MEDEHQVRLGAVQETLFIPLAARALQTQRKHPHPRRRWACDDPRSLERSGLEVSESVTITRPPRAMRGQLPGRYRYLLSLADPVLGKTMAVTLFRASSPAAAG